MTCKGSLEGWEKTLLQRVRKRLFSAEGRTVQRPRNGKELVAFEGVKKGQCAWNNGREMTWYKVNWRCRWSTDHRLHYWPQFLTSPCIHTVVSLGVDYPSCPWPLGLTMWLALANDSCPEVPSLGLDMISVFLLLSCILPSSWEIHIQADLLVQQSQPKSSEPADLQTCDNTLLLF